MCGVCGVVRWAGDDPDALLRVHEMQQLLEHRGPDDAGVTLSKTAALGTTRLAIRGHEAGNQPLCDPETGVVVVCNGEIDNHRDLARQAGVDGALPAGSSDVAVLPRLYLAHGARFVERLEGTFAIGVWDPRDATLLLARDRAGERPLFYRVDDAGVVFATELSALAAVVDGAPIDATAVAHYLRFGCFAAPLSPLSGICKVGPAHTVRFSLDEGVAVRRYWRWPAVPARSAAMSARSAAADVPDPPGVSDAADVANKFDARDVSVEAFDGVFREAVARQSDVDVEFGLFLSGGLDSSLVAAVARQQHPDRTLRAYTLRFDEASFDEGEAARRVARLLDLECHEVTVRPADLPRTIRELVRRSGEPLADPAWVPVALLAERAALDVKMVLVGEGGDELFGGYPTYFGAQLARRYDRLPAPVRRGFAAIVSRLPASDKKVAISYLLKRFVEGDQMPPLARHLLWTSNISPSLLARLGCEAVPAPLDEPAGNALLGTLQRHDFETSLAEGLLTKSDRATMASALEPRSPFLHREVMEFAAALPPNERVRGLRTKVFLKRYARRYLPRSIVHRRKRGLSVPLSAWLRGPLHDWASEQLAGGALEAAGLRSAAALELFAEHREGRADRARALWTLLVLVEWLQWRDAVAAQRS